MVGGSSGRVNGGISKRGALGTTAIILFGIWEGREGCFLGRKKMTFQNQPFKFMLFHFKWKSYACHWMLIFKKSFLNSIQIFWNISDIETNWEYIYFFLQLSKKKGKMKDCCSFITKIFCCRIWFDLFQNFNQLVVFFSFVA